MIALRVSAIIIALLLSGCTGGPSGSTCRGESCLPSDTPKITTGPIVLPPIEYPLSANRTLQFEECQGGSAVGRLPVEKAREVVPDDFVIDAAFGFVPRFAEVHINTIQCSRVVVNTTILPSVSMVRTAVFVTPREESWRGSGIDYYVLDTWFSSPELTAWFAPTRLPTQVATFKVEQIPAGGVPRVENWSIDGANCDVQTKFQVSGKDNGQSPEKRLDSGGKE